MKIALTVPEWIIAEIGEAKCRKIAQDVINECRHAGLAPREASECAGLVLEVEAGL